MELSCRVTRDYSRNLSSLLYIYTFSEKKGEIRNMSKRANGEGSLYQRKDGRWVAAISLENGKRKYLYHQTQAQAVVALQHANHSKLQGTLKQTRDETLETFLLNWLHTCIQPRVRERTLSKLS